MQCKIFIIKCRILLEPSQIYRLFITREEDILSFSTDIKKMKMDMHEKAATRFVRILRKKLL